MGLTSENMKQIKFEHRYEVGDWVYHITPESPKGVITNVRYSVLYGVDYLVAFGYNDDCWCFEHELSDEKTII